MRFRSASRLSLRRHRVPFALSLRPRAREPHPATRAARASRHGLHAVQHHARLAAGASTGPRGLASASVTRAVHAAVLHRASARATNTSRGISRTRGLRRTSRRGRTSTRRASASIFTYAYAPDLLHRRRADRRVDVRIRREHRRRADLRRRRVGDEGVLARSRARPRRQRVPARRQDAGAPVPHRQLADQRPVAGRQSVLRRARRAAPDSRWSTRRTSAGRFAEGLTYRSYRFRLATDTATPSGHRREQLHPAVPARHAQAHAATHASTSTAPSRPAASSSVDTENGGGLYSDDYKIGPALGATLVVEFLGCSVVTRTRSRRCTHAALAVSLAGCAIRYDDTGVSRVGIFLWGLGDPPGVNWNLGRAAARDSRSCPRRGAGSCRHGEPARDSSQIPTHVAPNRNAA